MTTNLPATPTLLQRLDFHLADGQRARALLTPVLAADGTRLVHVELDYAAAGSDMFAAIGNQGFNRTAIVAGTLRTASPSGRPRRAAASLKSRSITRRCCTGRRWKG